MLECKSTTYSMYKIQSDIYKISAFLKESHKPLISITFQAINLLSNTTEEEWNCIFVI